MARSLPVRAVPAVLVVLAATLAAAPPQAEDCPPQSRSPQCVEGPAPAGDDDVSSGSGQTPEERGQAPSTPPGQEPAPTTDGTQPGGTDEQPSPTRPDGGGSRPEAPEDPDPPRSSTPDRVTDDGWTVADEHAGDEDDADAEDDDEGEVVPDIPAPPPDLGARRVLATRVSRGPAGLEVVIDVEEARARGVDGGWTVTVAGATVGATAVDAWARDPDGPVGLIVGRTPRTVGAPAGFTVLGQRSTTVYDARYSALIPGGPSPTDAPPVITVTLFQ